MSRQEQAGENKDDPSYKGRNTFLSRIFGLQSEDISPLTNTAEMSNYPTRGRQFEGQSGKSTNTFETIPFDEEMNIDMHTDNNLQNQGSQDFEEQRIPESDQEPSTSEDDDGGDIRASDYGNEDFGVQPFHYADNDDFDAANINNNDKERKANKMYASIPKIGQMSLEEDNDSIENEEESVLHSNDDFNNTNNNIQNNYSLSIDNDDLIKNSFLFRNILHTKNPPKKLFTASPDSNIISNSSLGNSKVKNSQWDNDNRRSFIFQDRTDNNKNNYSNETHTFNKRTNLIPNISILNNKTSRKISTLSNKEKALWKWANVENLDAFLQDIYYYFLGNGFSCIMLQKCLNLLTLIFVVYISTYMGYCIDYSKLPNSHKVSDITIPQCYQNNISGMVKFLLWIFYIFIILKIIQLYFDYKNLTDIHNFYNYLLNISDNDLQTIPWQNVIQQIMLLKDQNALTANVVEVKAKNRLDAHDIANRIMRKENYLIALYNNDILDLSLPIPFFSTSILTMTLEWNINLCIIGYAFNEAGFIKQSFLKTSQHQYIRDELQKRFMLAGFLNIILSPFLVSYFILLYFFKYFNEYKTSPGSISVRQYTPMAEWKFREYNELYHIFRKRIGLSTPLAEEYVNQFPKEKFNILMRFIAFIAGSFVAILALMTVFDSENFLNFEITNDKSTLFYLTVLGTIWTITRNSISQEYNTFDPEDKVKEVSKYTHYLPNEWEGKIHTEEIRTEFCKLFNLRVIILLRELTSLILTPFILWFSLPKRTDKIIEFFRETSVYIDGLGYVCKYAMFDIDRNNKKQQPTNGRKKSVLLSNNSLLNNDLNPKESAVNKMVQSYMYFVDDYNNDDNVVGKYQLPTKHYTNTKNNSTLLNNYSWKKQFRPGQDPKLFKIGRTDDSKNHGNFRGRNSSIQESSSSQLNSTLGNISKNPERKEGVLKLVREYYKQSDL